MYSGLTAGALILASYLLGAIPFALLAGKLKGIDIRKHGSGNLGATNAIRVLGKPVGLTVFVLDFLKGFIPVMVVRFLPAGSVAISEFMAFSCGAAAVVGHIFPVYLKFKGGKGVAATAGMLLAVRWDAALIACGVFFPVRRLTGYVSLSSIALAVTFPSALYLLHPSRAMSDYKWVLIGSCLLALLIIYRHKGNIGRILRGEEPKVGRKSPD